MNTFDLIVIGAGPAGYVTAIRASQLGLEVALVEEKEIGGVCLNVGCIPSKSLLKNAELVHLLRNESETFGISFEKLNLDFSAAVKRSRRVSERLTRGVEYLLRKHEITILPGRGELVSGDTVRVTGENGVQDIQADDIVIATGARPLILPGVEVDGSRILTYREAILQETLPESVIIIGAGAIGMEFATIWSSYGADVTIVEMLDRVLPQEDPEVSAALEKAVNQAGIKTSLGSRVSDIQVVKDQVEVHVESAEGTGQFAAEQALLAASFVPNTESLGLDQVGVEVSSGGFIEIDQAMQTSRGGIWAVGDVTGKLMLAHVGMAMGVVCAEQIAGEQPRALDYRMMPRATFSRPQVASFGFTQEEAEKAGYEVRVGKFTFRANGKALGMNHEEGWVKIIAEKQYGEILGAHLIGPEVTELLPELTLAQRMELTPQELIQNVHAHPTLGEVVHEASLAVFGDPLHM